MIKKLCLPSIKEHCESAEVQRVLKEKIEMEIALEESYLYFLTIRG